ncbi:MAG: Gfo/Idh/MocA family oxidoreductase [Terricaulis sp.]
MAIKLGIVGVGVIARSQHLPVVAESEAFELVAAASRNARVDGVKTFATLDDMLEGAPEVEAVALCAPPIARTQDARIALRAGKHVLLEKPPGATLSEVHELVALAEEHRVTLFASWHSRHARAVGPARDWLRGRAIRSAQVSWREDIRVWHPGQEWILAPGGLGVFDPGINALSILTHILPAPFALRSAKLAFPGNRQAPIGAELSFADAHGAPIHAVFDFLQTGHQTWDIRVETDQGRARAFRGRRDRACRWRGARARGGDECAARGICRRLCAFRRSGRQWAQRRRPCAARPCRGRFHAGRNA